MEAIILAGGQGTRLAGVIQDVPKPMAPVGGFPFLAWLLTYLIHQGYQKVILSVGYKKDAIQSYFGANYGPLALQYSTEDTPLGTGGAIQKALLMTANQHTTVINGDTFYALNHQTLYKRHSAGQTMTMALRTVDNATRYGTVDTDQEQKIVSFSGPHDGPGLINAGVYILSADIFANIEVPISFSFEKDFLENHIAQLSIRGFIDDSFFIDIGIPKDYQRAQTSIPRLFSSQVRQAGPHPRAK
ncbi:MAG: nucleotidyltransferase family protein [Myxococcota bacterium]|jgi:D-glycero-alpha-D-manno-heptose 1-phosphate guanylyltransferase|nr:nucleotidyltransferase family protein [Myxococcota bacterium]